MVKVSVILCVFNGEKYLRESLQSIENQTYKNIEVVLVDDCSTDSSMTIIDDFIKNTSHSVIFIKNERNLGLTASLNIALNNATGEYFARQDADDISHLDRIEKCVNFIKRNPELDVDLLVTSFQRFNSQLVIDTRPQRHFFSNNYLKVGMSILKYGNIYAHGTYFGKVSVIQNLQYNVDFLKAQDYELLLRYLKLNKNVFFISDLTYYLRLHDESISSTEGGAQTNFAKKALEINGFNSNKHIESSSGIRKIYLKLVKVFSIL